MNHSTKNNAVYGTFKKKSLILTLKNKCSIFKKKCLSSSTGKQQVTMNYYLEHSSNAVLIVKALDNIFRKYFTIQGKSTQLT